MVWLQRVAMATLLPGVVGLIFGLHDLWFVAILAAGFVAAGTYIAISEYRYFRQRFAEIDARYTRDMAESDERYRREMAAIDAKHRRAE